MQSSFSIQISIVLALLSASSQALPILDSNTGILPRNPEPIIYPPPIHNHVKRNQNGNEDVFPFYGLHSRQLVERDESKDLESRHIPDRKPEEPIFDNSNTPALPIEAPDSTTTLTSTTTAISTTITTPTEEPVRTKLTASQLSSKIRHRPIIPGLAVTFPFPIPPAHPASPQGPPAIPASFPSIHHLHATEWNKHQPNVGPGESEVHNGSRGESVLGTNPLLVENDGVHGWKPSSALKSLFTRPRRVLVKIMVFIKAPIRMPGLGPGGTIHIHKIPASTPSRIHRFGSIPGHLRKFFSKLKASLKMPGVGPAGGIYLMSSSPLMRENNPLYNTDAENYPGGTIHMASPSLTNSVSIPIHFTLSPQTCGPIALECECMARDLATRLVNSYPDGIAASTNSIIETISHAMGGKEYRATLELNIDSFDKGIDGKQFKDLAGLLISVHRELGNAMKGRGFGTLKVHGDWYGVGVEALWTYYEVEGGIARQCTATESLSKHKPTAPSIEPPTKAPSKLPNLELA